MPPAVPKGHDATWRRWSHSAIDRDQPLQGSLCVSPHEQGGGLFFLMGEIGGKLVPQPNYC